MENAVYLLLAVAAAYICALTAPLLWFQNRYLTVAGVVCTVAAVLACPLLIPSQEVMLRALAAFVSTDLMFRMIDYARCRRERRADRTFREYYRFLLPFPVLLVVFPEHKRRLAAPVPWLPEIARVLGGAAGCAAAVLLLAAAATNAALRASFPLDHFAIVLLFVPTIESIARMLYGLERLAGFRTRPIVRNAFAARTVAEFWQRYNYRVHDWLYQNAFRPSGGRRAPIRGIILVFLVSGVLHELVFDIATSSCDGYQLAFFLLQVPAVLASGPLARLAERGGIAAKIAAHGSTTLYMSVTSVFFFHGVNKVFPIVYVSAPWLP